MFCLLLLAGTLHIRAQITWGPAVNIGVAGASDVSTNGFGIYAETWGNSGTTLNGVTFIQDASQTGDGNVTIAYAAGGVDKHGEGTGGSGTAYYALISSTSAYTALIQGTDWGANANPGTITLNNLTPGHVYQVQIWENDSRGGTYSGRNATFTSTNGNLVTLACYVGGNGSSSPAGGLGQYAIGTFTAASVKQVVNLTGGGTNPADQINSIQVRDVTPGLSPPVILTDNGNGTVTMNNGIVTMTCGKGGDVSYFALDSLSTTNLIDSKNDYALILTHIGGQGNDYWVSVGSGGSGSTYSVVTNNGQIVDIMVRNPNASGNTALYPNGEWDWAEHHVMRAGEAGFYTYHVWRHWTNQPAAYYWADSWQGYCGSIFNTTTNADGSVNDAWDFSASDVPVNVLIDSLPPLGANPPNDAVPGEVAILPKSSYLSQPTGNFYEPGWPIYTQPLGLTSDLYPTTTKYDQCSYLGASNSFRPVWGMATDQVGLWSILGSFEFINGGPTKQKGSVSGNYMYNDDAESHGLGSVNDPGVADGQVFTKVVGPYFMYANSGTNHLQLWTNAQSVAAQMVSNWPYAWMDESETDYPRHRGTLTGTLKAKTGESTANAVVILGDYTDGDWMYQGVTNFLFWTTSDSNGNFSIPKVRPGNYQLFSYVPGIWGELQISNIIVLPDQTNQLGVINWNPPHRTQRLWRIGTPDHSSAEFHHGNYRKQFGLWWRYLHDMGTNDLNFIIGQSVESNDWYYAQCSMATTPQSYPNLTDHTQTNGIYWSPHWNVLFNLTNLPPTPVLTTIALAGGNGAYFYMYLNGVNVTPDAYHGQGTADGTDIYRDVVTVGRYQYYQFTFATNLFKVGTNTFTITIRQPGASGSWSGTSYPELLQGGLIYDFLQMEAGPQVILASPPAAPTGLSATAVSRNQINLAWTNPATNALSVEIVRSTNGVNFTSIGAVLPGVSNYADTNPPAGIVSYYEVLANNVDGNSPASNLAQASTPPAAPANLNAQPGYSQITLDWSASVGATNYAILRGTSSGNETTIAGATTNLTYADGGLLIGGNYYYVVVATGPFGSSLNSAEVSAAPFGARSLIWRGDGVTNTWDLGHTTNWQVASVPTYFDNGDSVTFDNTGSNNLPVSLNGTLQPALVTVNSANNYTLGGPGSISGTNSLVKSGPGTLTLASVNTYTGGTIINAGTINFGQPQILTLSNAATSSSGQLPAVSPVSIAANATLDLSGFSQSIASLSDIGGSGGWLTNSSGTYVTLMLSNHTATTNTFSGMINDAGGNAISLTKAGSYTQVLAGSNSYSGPTSIVGGSLFVNGSLGGGSVTVVNSLLGGQGTINGATTINAGGILAPGASGLGTLSFANSLTLNSGSETIMAVSHDWQTNSVLDVAGAFTWGGALVVGNADAPLQGGDTFKLFTAGSFAGNFSGVTLPPVAPGLYWNTNTFPVDGTLRVGTETPPVIGNLGLVGGSLVLAGSGGITNGTYYVLASTNLAAPLTNWTRVLTNQFDAGGNFNSTNALNTNSTQTFYLLQLQ